MGREKVDLDHKIQSLIEVDIATGCWIWRGSFLQKSGYGRIKVKGRDYVAHRFIYERYVEPVPKELQLDHLCRVRLCVNPQHLEPVTPYENQLRGSTFTKKFSESLTCSRGHEKIPENIFLRKDGRYRCKLCKRLKESELRKLPKYKEKHAAYERERRKRKKS